MDEPEIGALVGTIIFCIVLTFGITSKEGPIVGAVVGFVAIVVIAAVIYAFMEIG